MKKRLLPASLLFSLLALASLASCRLGGISENEASHSVNGPLYQSAGDSAQDTLPAEINATARTMLYTSGQDGSDEPSYILKAPRLEISYWTHSNGSPRQALVHAPYERGSWQVYYGTDGSVKKIQDLRTGSIYTIDSIGEGHLRFSTFQSDGSFVESYDMVAKGERIYVGPTPGVPVFTGQITGTLAGSVQNGSFAVIADASDANVGLQPLGSEWQPLIDALASLPDSESGSALAKRRTYAFTLSTTLKRGGVVLFGAYLAGIIAPAATAYAAAGIAMYCSGLATTDLAQSFRKHFDDPDMPEGIRAIGASVIDCLDDNTSTGLIGWAQKAKDMVARTSLTVDNIYQRFGKSQAQGDYEDATLSREPDLVSFSRETPLDPVTQPSRPVSVHGQAADQAGNLYPLQGSVGADGKLRLGGTSANGNTVNISGTLQGGALAGSFSVSDGNQGSVEAKEQALGTCQAVNKDGGQGAFTYVHTLSGATQASFSYNAYEIPDQFTVSSTSGGVLYATAGLVAGTGSSGLAAGADGMVIVTVTAPTEGTLWDYSISCQ